MEEEEDVGRAAYIDRTEWTLDNEHTDRGQWRIVKRGNFGSNPMTSALTGDGHGQFMDKGHSGQSNAHKTPWTHMSTGEVTEDLESPPESRNVNPSVHCGHTPGWSLDKPEHKSEEGSLIGMKHCNDLDKTSDRLSELDPSYELFSSLLPRSDIIESPRVEGGVKILRQIRRSVSIDKDGRRSQLSNRLVERRRTLEVDNGDLSGVGTRHVSCLEFRVGPPDTREEEPRMVSEINVVWGKIVDADNALVIAPSSSDTPADFIQSPTQTRSMDDSLDYWSADMSSDSFMTFDSDDTFVDTGDSMYTSGSNNSFIERSELFLDVSQRSVSLEPQNISIFETVGDRMVELTRLDARPLFEDDIEFVESPRLVSKMFVDRRKTVDVRTPDMSSGHWPKERGAKRELFRVSETIALLGRGLAGVSTSRDADSEDSSYQTDTERIATAVSEAEDGSETEPPLMSPFDDWTAERLRGSQEDIRDLQGDGHGGGSVTVMKFADGEMNLVESGFLLGGSPDGATEGGRYPHSLEKHELLRSQEDKLFLHTESLETVSAGASYQATRTDQDSMQDVHYMTESDSSSHTVEDSFLRVSDHHGDASHGKELQVVWDLTDEMICTSTADKLQVNDMQEKNRDSATTDEILQTYSTDTFDNICVTEVTDEIVQTDSTDEIHVADRSDNICVTEVTDDIVQTDSTDEIHVTGMSDNICVTEVTDEIVQTDSTGEIHVTDMSDNICVTEVTDDIVQTDSTDEIHVVDMSDNICVTEVTDEIIQTDSTGEIRVTEIRDEIVQTDESVRSGSADEIHVTEITDDIVQTYIMDESVLTGSTDEIHVTEITDEIVQTYIMDESVLTGSTDEIHVTEITDEIVQTDKTGGIIQTYLKDEIHVAETTDRIRFTEKTGEHSTYEITHTDIMDNNTGDWSISKVEDLTNTSVEIKNQVTPADSKADDMPGVKVDADDDGEFITVVNKKKNRRKKKQDLEMSDKTINDRDVNTVTGVDSSVCTVLSTERSEDFIETPKAPTQLRRPRGIELGAPLIEAAPEANTSFLQPHLNISDGNDVFVPGYEKADNFFVTGDVVHVDRSQGDRLTPAATCPGELETNSLQSTEDFVSGILHGQSVAESEISSDFLHMDDGTLLNMAISRRRILKPRRRLAKPPNVAVSDAKNDTQSNTKDTLAITTDTSAITTDTPAITADTPSFTADTPSFTADTPAIATDTPAIIADTPAIITDTPSNTTDTAAMSGVLYETNETEDATLHATDTPSITTVGPAVTTGSQPVTTVSPAITADIAAVTTDAPAIATDTPVVSDPTPPDTDINSKDGARSQKKSKSRSKRKLNVSSKSDVASLAGADIDKDAPGPPTDDPRSLSPESLLAPSCQSDGSGDDVSSSDSGQSPDLRSAIQRPCGQVDRAESFIDVAIPSSLVMKRSVGFETVAVACEHIEERTSGNIASGVSDDVLYETVETEDTTLHVTFETPDDTTLHAACVQTEPSLTLGVVETLNDKTAIEGETVEDRTTFVEAVEDTTYAYEKVKDTTTAVETEDTTTAIQRVEDTTTAIPTVEDTTTAVETEDTTAIQTVEDTTTVVETVEDTTTAVETEEDTTTAIQTVEDTTTAVVTVEDTTTAIQTVEDTTTAVETVEDTTTDIQTVEDTTTAVETEDTTAIQTVEDTTTTVETVEDTTTAFRTIDSNSLHIGTSGETDHVHSMQETDHVHSTQETDHVHSMQETDHVHSMQETDLVHSMQETDHVHSMQETDHVHSMQETDHVHSMQETDQVHSMQSKNQKRKKKKRDKKKKDKTAIGMASNVDRTQPLSNDTIDDLASGVVTESVDGTSTNVFTEAAEDIQTEICVEEVDPIEEIGDTPSQIVIEEVDEIEMGDTPSKLVIEEDDTQSELVVEVEDTEIDDATSQLIIEEIDATEEVDDTVSLLTVEEVEAAEEIGDTPSQLVIEEDDTQSELVEEEIDDTEEINDTLAEIIVEEVDATEEVGDSLPQLVIEEDDTQSELVEEEIDDTEEINDTLAEIIVEEVDATEEVGDSLPQLVIEEDDTQSELVVEEIDDTEVDDTQSELVVEEIYDTEYDDFASQLIVEEIDDSQSDLVVDVGDTEKVGDLPSKKLVEEVGTREDIFETPSHLLIDEFVAAEDVVGEVDEIEVGDAPSQLVVEEVDEIEVGDAPSQLVVGEVDEIEVGDAPSQLVVEVDELEVGDAPSQLVVEEVDEIEVGDAPSQLVVEEVDDAPSQLVVEEVHEIEVGDAPSQLVVEEVVDAPSQLVVEEVDEIEVGDAPSQLIVEEVDEIEVGDAPSHLVVEVHEIEVGDAPSQLVVKEVDEIEVGDAPSQLVVEEVHEIEVGDAPSQLVVEEVHEMEVGDAPSQLVVEEVHEIEVGDAPSQLVVEEVGDAPSQLVVEEVDEIEVGDAPSQLVVEEVDEIEVGDAPSQPFAEEVHEIEVGDAPSQLVVEEVDDAPSQLVVEEVDEIEVGDAPSQLVVEEVDEIEVGDIPSQLVVEEVGDAPSQLIVEEVDEIEVGDAMSQLVIEGNDNKASELILHESDNTTSQLIAEVDVTYVGSKASQLLKEDMDATEEIFNEPQEEILEINDTALRLVNGAADELISQVAIETVHDTNDVKDVKTETPPTTGLSALETKTFTVTDTPLTTSALVDTNIVLEDTLAADTVTTHDEAATAVPDAVTTQDETVTEVNILPKVDKKRGKKKNNKKKKPPAKNVHEQGREVISDSPITVSDHPVDSKDSSYFDSTLVTIGGSKTVDFVNQSNSIGIESCLMATKDCSVSEVNISAVERSEETVAVQPKQTVRFNRQLYEDVLKNKARAEEVVAQSPESPNWQVAGGVGGEATLTPAARLMSEMALLETAAKEQTESLQLAVAHKEHYDKQVALLNKGIAEAQQKLQASPVNATSVGDLKKQMMERNNLASQIKKAQVVVNEIQEKSRQLSLDSSMLSPKVFRKHYLPESAYTDFFSAIAQHQRGSSLLPPFSTLFYDSLPTFSSDIPEILQGFAPAAPESDQQVPAGVVGAEQSSGDAASLDFVLPKKIPSPRTDSIPRPTWSESIPSRQGPASDQSGNYSLTQSLDSPLSTARSFEASSPVSTTLPPRVSSMSSDLVSSRINAPYSAMFATEVGPSVSSMDSGMDSTVSSLADKLTSSAHWSSHPPAGGSPTEILRMLEMDSFMDSDGASTEVTSETTVLADDNSDDLEASWNTLLQQVMNLPIGLRRMQQVPLNVFI
ncbi:hypothetical protein Btru_056900 [Bulinus truncatus]|nr:hypothetical protein Btru_056900 [Bulinus truncatus]